MTPLERYKKIKKLRGKVLYYTRLNRKDKGRYLAVFRHLRVEPQPTGNSLTLSRSDRV